MGDSIICYITSTVILCIAKIYPTPQNQATTLQKHTVAIYTVKMSQFQTCGPKHSWSGYQGPVSISITCKGAPAPLLPVSTQDCKMWVFHK